MAGSIFDYAAGKAFAGILGGAFVIWVVVIVMMAQMKDQINYPAAALVWTIILWAVTLGFLYFVVIYAPGTHEGG
jgi:hypothetical protein